MTSTTTNAYTIRAYVLSTHERVVGVVATWDEAIELARGYWGTTPSVRAAEAASTYTITVHGDYVGTLSVELLDALGRTEADVEAQRARADAAAEVELAAELLANESRAAGRRVERDWSTLATGGTFVSPAVELVKGARATHNGARVVVLSTGSSLDGVDVVQVRPENTHGGVGYWARRDDLVAV